MTTQKNLYILHILGIKYFLYQPILLPLLRWDLERIYNGLITEL